MCFFLHVELFILSFLFLWFLGNHELVVLPKSYKNRKKKNLKPKRECVGRKNPFEVTGEFLLSLEMAVVGEDNTKAWIFECD